MARLGVEEETAELPLGHVPQGIVWVYIDGFTVTDAVCLLMNRHCLFSDQHPKVPEADIRLRVVDWPPSLLYEVFTTPAIRAAPMPGRPRRH